MTSSISASRRLVAVVVTYNRLDKLKVTLARLDSHVVEASGQIAQQDSWDLPGFAQGVQLTALASLTYQGMTLVYGLADGGLQGWLVSETGGGCCNGRGAEL